MPASKPKPTKTKNKGGRPPEAVEDKIDLLQVEKLAGLGLTDVEIGHVIGVTEQTVNNWKTDDEFLLVLKRGKEKADSRVVQSLYKRACGYKFLEKTIEGIKTPAGKLTTMQRIKTVVKEVEPNVTACIFWLKNRRPQDWRDVKEGVPATPEDEKPGNVEMLIADAEKRVKEEGKAWH